MSQGPELGAKWRPLLHGQRAEQARATVEEIAEAVRHHCGLRGDPSTNHSLDLPLGLGTGLAGCALFLAEAARLLDDSRYLRAAVRLLNRALTGLASRATFPSLFSGVSGIAWVVHRIQEDNPELGAADSTAAVDEHLTTLVRNGGWNGSFDLIFGLVGFGVYLLDRSGTSEVARQGCEAVLVRLRDSAIRSRVGATWLTQATLLPPHQRSAYPLGRFDVGVAHGVGGVVAFLAKCVQSDRLPSWTEELLRHAVRWLQHVRLPSSEATIFPHLVAPGLKPVSGRTAWCYGDPGVGMALLAAGRALGAEELIDEAVEILVAAGQRTPSEAKVHDVSLCHGASGLAHLCNRVGQWSGSSNLSAVAVRWIDVIFQMRSGQDGIAGFHYRTVKDGAPTWVAQPGFLCGAAGVGLALASSVAAWEPKWDRALLLG